MVPVPSGGEIIAILIGIFVAGGLLGFGIGYWF